jgi:hypothetical protein
MGSTPDGFAVGNKEKAHDHDYHMPGICTIAVHSNIGTNVVGLTCWSASYNGGAATPPYHAEMIRPANSIVISHSKWNEGNPQNFTFAASG